MQSDLRAAMPITEAWAYFDHAAVAPLCQPAAEAIQLYATQASHAGDTVWLTWKNGVEHTRRRAAKLLGAKADEITLTTNTTHGINLVAEGLDWLPGDNVVVLCDEFPSNLYPWMHLKSRGVETRLVSTDAGRVDPDKLREACDRRTRLVTFSWIAYGAGERRDIDSFIEVAQECGANGGRGAWVLLDAIQGLGVFPLDVSQTPIDFLSADGHKWLLGPEGAGIAYLREERLEEIRPTGVGWNSVVGCQEFGKIELEFKPSAARFEGGSINMAGQLALGASLGLLLGHDRDEVAAAVLEITDYLCQQLRRHGASIHSHRSCYNNGHDPRSGIVSVSLPGHDPGEIRTRCAAERIAISVREGRLRLSPHAYTTKDEVDHLVSTLPPAP
ncbi:aminotransferase class V-fold PLP-dependent enzyme [Botrimarina hoheduenensis]|uniref:aminotransferase class V-fold PLP-dependent enzyme n=1 Tax=Botrimarina hoheduenensis TaxID=2528000 RepID=UPI0018D48176|nr:aminotransferase class V-fold PLP-dependent enzyme [Botrimarina hoheduenensis]